MFRFRALTSPACPTLLDMNGLYLLAVLRSHANTMALSVHRKVSSNWKQHSSFIETCNLEANTAACSSSCGIVSSLRGATLDLAATRDGAVVRALAFHQCGPGSIPGLDVICGLSLLLVLFSALRGFSPGTPVFPSPQKPTFLNSNSIRNARKLNT